MTYHSSSDVPVPYGRVVPRFEGEEERDREKKEKARDYHAEKSKGVALLASNCGYGWAILSKKLTIPDTSAFFQVIGKLSKSKKNIFGNYQF